MNVLLVAGRVAAHPWSSGSMAARVACSLASRGHRITLLCDSIDDPAPFECADSVNAFRPFISGAPEYPPGFPRWARARIAATPRDAVLSLSRRVSGNVWMPIEPDAPSWLGARLSTSTPINALASASRHTGVLLDALDELFHPLPRGPAIRRVVCIGGPSAESAAAFRRANLAARIVRAPLTSDLPLPKPTDQLQLRRTTRATLNLADDRPVILVSLMRGQPRAFDALLGAIAGLNPGSARRPGPALIVLTREPYRAHASAARARSADHVRILGTTLVLPAALAACDAAATCSPFPFGPFRAGTCAVPADAIRSGRPVLALAGSSGTALLGLSTPEIPVPGAVVSGPSIADWTRALNQLADPDWLARTTRAAARLAPMLDSERLTDCLESALADAVCGAGFQPARREL